MTRQTVIKHILIYTLIAIGAGWLIATTITNPDIRLYTILKSPPQMIILSGVIGSIFIQANKLMDFFHEAAVRAVLFGVLFGLVTEIILYDPREGFGGLFILGLFGGIPLHLFGLFIGMIIKGILERIPWIARA